MAGLGSRLVGGTQVWRGGRIKGTALALACALASGCAPLPVSMAPGEEPSVLPADRAPESSAPPSPPRVRFFVASERTDHVWVLEGDPPALVAKVKVGRMPHNISVSPDGRWVAVANRMASSVSVIDPFEIREVARVMVGKQPHELIWSPDAKTIYVGSERDGYIHRIEAGTWKALMPLPVRVPQHSMAIWRERPNELWFTVTNSDAPNHLRVLDVETKKITEIAVSDVHDVYFTPDGSEVWTSSSGFLCKPSDRMVVYDPATKTVKQEIRFPGRYPFHAMKHNRDATFFVESTETMPLSDHQQESLMLVNWRERAIVASVTLRDASLKVDGKCGIEPFHTAYTPGRYYITSNKDNSVRIIDARTLAVLGRVEVPTPHGIVFVPLP